MEKVDELIEKLAEHIIGIINVQCDGIVGETGTCREPGKE